MKTTLEIPDELHGALKARAAASRRRLADLVTEGLRLYLERELAHDEGRTLLKVLERIRKSPLCPPEATAARLGQARREREDAWGEEAAAN